MNNPSNAHERMTARIEAALPAAGEEETRVLTFIKSRLTPEAIAERDEEDRGVGHLLAVAAEHLRSIERKSGNAS